ncbi:CoA transferase, partial [Candidatus Acetothermia bacterium]|nr:CoA transferase [Candidatus Acetothermia bacterium]
MAGTRILDLTRLLPGPYASLLMADLGAEIIKVEEPNTGDPVRWLSPSTGELSYPLALLNRNKKSLTLNLRAAEGRELFLKLAEHTDVVFESFRPGVVQRLGIDYESVKKVQAKIIYCSLSGYGQEGPYRERVGHDVNYIGVAGLLNLTG